MKRILKSLAAVALVALTASCSKEQPVAPPSGEAAVEFTVAAPELMTKAIADGKTVDKVACEVYNADGKLITNAEISKTIAMSGGKATFAVRLVTGQTYSFLFWAYKDGAPYTLDAAGKKVTVDYAGASNAENRDAFYAYVADKKITSSVNETVTLTRPFAQVNFGVTKADIDAAANSGIVVKKSSVKVSGLATELNLTDGSVSGTAEASFTVAALPDEDLTVGGTAYGYVAMNYVLVGKDAKSLSDVELKLYKEDGTEINTVSVPNVPLQGNYRTNILGNLFTSDVQLNVVVNPGFSEPDYEKEVWDGSTVNEPKQDAEGNTSSPRLPNSPGWLSRLMPAPLSPARQCFLPMTSTSIIRLGLRLERLPILSRGHLTVRIIRFPAFMSIPLSRMPIWDCSAELKAD